ATCVGEVHRALILGKQGRRRLDAGAGGGYGEHLIDHPSGNDEMRGLRFAGLRVGLGDCLFNSALLAAEQIEVVADAAAHGIEIEDRITARGSYARRVEAET